MRLLFGFACVLLCHSAISQPREHKVKPYVEAGVGISTGISRYVYTKFIDPRIGISYQVSEKIGLNAELAYACFFRKSKKEGISFLPLSAGIEYKMVSDFFLKMQVGGALILDGSGELYFITEPGCGWQFDSHHSVLLSYYGFVANSVAIGGINLGYRFMF